MRSTHPTDTPSTRSFKLVLMRILIASYLMAVSVGIAPGPDLVPTLKHFMPETQATIIGAAALFLPAYTMMAGICLRASIHVIAMMVVLATALDTLVFNDTPKLGTLWQEAVTLCALLQCLMLMKGRHFRHSSLVKRKVAVRRLDPQTRLRAVLPVTPLQDTPALVPVPVHTKRNDIPDDEDVVNIFN